MSDSDSGYDLATLLREQDGRLRRLLESRMPAALRRRVSVDDVLQELWVAAGRRPELFTASPEIPPYVKVRALALQTLADLCRHHLGAAKRAVGREHEPVDESAEDPLLRVADTLSSPLSRLAREEKSAAVRAAVAALPEADREVLRLRHFEELGNTEAAAVLGIEPKAASARYIRALQRLQAAIAGQSGLRP